MSLAHLFSFIVNKLTVLFWPLVYLLPCLFVFLHTEKGELFFFVFWGVFFVVVVFLLLCVCNCLSGFGCSCLCFNNNYRILDKYFVS